MVPRNPNARFTYRHQNTAGDKLSEGVGALRRQRSIFVRGTHASPVSEVPSPLVGEGQDEGVSTKVGTSLSRNDYYGAYERITLTLILSHQRERKETSAPSQ